MKHKIKYLLLSTFVIAIVGVSSDRIVYADGGSVQTNGRVSFYTETSTEPTESSYPKTSGDSDDSVAKPVGKLPSTGELVVKSLTISGGIVLVIGGIFILLKKRREAK
ncbi:LPXTG cell wall anchor domain-containing protein [Candidatus Enterococcus mansonii]|uniref:Gram-positive cocci surface proteins LPxTG domain-containing protein n=1 Tax=Candidatus Enterococcus mansonii TaxID=1834181 RepID=A0A242CER8_9ENTE|nr:LPXTG cell wall anchor domain-containing protein [Enterococcus sp. 4G2_DIV0659]OTO08733.1 hypothetical protein A5880_001733 [Enterococcus sp. 4G2_DIV0659]